MGNVIWGTGYYASLFTLKIGRENVSFYIDKDEKKSGKFLGKRVVLPDEINKWDNMCVYVPYNYYEEISAFLQSKGLIENKSFYKYNEFISLTRDYLEKDFLRACREVDELDAVECRNSTAWCGRFWATKKEYRRCIKKLKENNNSFVVLADTPWYKKEEIENEIQCPAVVLPAIMHDTIFMEDDIYDESFEGEENLEKTIKFLFDNIAVRHRGISQEKSLYKAKMCAEFVEYLFNKLEFKTFIIGGSDRGINKLIRDMCRKYEVPTLFTHQGVVPGTIMMGPGGDIGDSVPSVYHKQFLQLPVDEQWINDAKNVWCYLKESRANRKAQPHNDVIKEIKDRICQSRPIVLCLGQNDLDSTLIPYTEESRKYQSPIFKSSIESLLYISDICNKNNWNLVYKPHPMYATFEDYKSLPNNVILVQFGDINDLIDLANVVVTIRSSSNYIALIRYKPVLMLGYSQTRGQKCTYEAFDKRDVEPQLKKAIEEGFTKEQQRAFVEHLARLLRYYLYDDMSERPIRYGMKYPKDVEDFFSLEKELGVMKR